MKLEMLAMLAVAVCCVCSGCKTTVENQGEVWLEYGTKIGFGHRAADTHCKATSEVESQPLLDYLAKMQTDAAVEAEPEDAGTNGIDETAGE